MEAGQPAGQPMHSPLPSISRSSCSREEDLAPTAGCACGAPVRPPQTPPQPRSAARRSAIGAAPRQGPGRPRCPQPPGPRKSAAGAPAWACMDVQTEVWPQVDGVRCGAPRSPQRQRDWAHHHAPCTTCSPYVPQPRALQHEMPVGAAPQHYVRSRVLVQLRRAGGRRAGMQRGGEVAGKGGRAQAHIHPYFRAWLPRPIRLLTCTTSSPFSPSSSSCCSAATAAAAAAEVPPPPPPPPAAAASHAAAAVVAAAVGDMGPTSSSSPLSRCLCPAARGLKAVGERGEQGEVGSSPACSSATSCASRCGE